MNYDIRDLLLNVMFIFFPIFLYHIIRDNNTYLNKKQGTMLNAVLLALSIVLCMTFPIKAMGYKFDLRLIPFIIGILYASYNLELFLFLTLNVYRFILGESNYIGSFIINSIVLLILLIILPKIKRYSSQRRIRLMILLSTFFSIIILFYFYIAKFYELNSRDILFSIEFVFIQAIGMWLSTYLIEMMSKNVRLRKEISQTEKLKVVSEIAASVSHEVRNPLTVTKGFIQLLRNNDLTDEKKVRFIDLALEELKRAELIINDYLSLAKPQEELEENLKINEEIIYVVDVMSPFALMKQIEIKVSQLVVETTVKGERFKFRQSLINLIKNSVESMQDGGVLHIQVIAHLHQVVIKIVDTGNGMDKSQMEQLGSPFVSTKEKGTGLGTMVTYRIIEAMGGKIKVQSKIGVGTEFSIHLPII